MTVDSNVRTPTMEDETIVADDGRSPAVVPVLAEPVVAEPVVAEPAVEKAVVADVVA